MLAADVKKYDEILSDFNENSVIYIYRLEPFELLRACDSELRKEITGSEFLDDLPENKSDVIEGVTKHHSYEEKSKEVYLFFKNTPSSEWRKVLTLRTSKGEDRLFLVTANACDLDSSGGVDTIIVRLESIPYSDSNIEQLSSAVARHNKNLYKESLASLSKTEYKVFKELVSGLTIMEIAEKFYRSKYTIESHSANIKKKLNCKNLSEVVKIGVKIGFTS